jgi:hypothetical protein
VALRRSFPVTAAGPQRICTVFPILSSQQQAAGTPRVSGGNVAQPLASSRHRMDANEKRRGGCDYRLTDVHGNVVTKILA